MTSQRELEAHLRRHFGDVPAIEIARLHRAWQALLADRDRLAAQADGFLPENRVGWGLSWWEERQGDDPTRMPEVTDLDQASLMITLDTAGRVRPRPYCPPRLVGTWTLAAISRDGITDEAPAAPRRWALSADGSLDTGDASHAGWTWRVHRNRYDELWFGPARRPDQQRRLILRRDGDRIVLSIPGDGRGHEIWTVAP